MRKAANAVIDSFIWDSNDFFLYVYELHRLGDSCQFVIYYVDCLEIHIIINLCSIDNLLLLLFGSIMVEDFLWFSQI